MGEAMLERVGRAARGAALEYSLTFQALPTDDPSKAVGSVVQGREVVFSGPVAACQTFISLAVGRAAIEAMREPTEEMLAAGARSCGDDMGNPDETAALCCFEAMIDAILSPPATEGRNG